MSKTLTFVFLSLTIILGSCSTKSNLPDNFCGKYYSRDVSGSTLDDYVEIKKDGTWAWFDEEGKKCAFGEYTAEHKGKWAMGPDSWAVSFTIKGGELSSYFDSSQMIYFHDLNNVTGESNYYRMNGLMPETEAATDFYKN
jgi:hypothetical protein